MSTLASQRSIPAPRAHVPPSGHVPNITKLSDSCSTQTPVAGPTVPILDLTPEIDSLWDELQTAIRDVVRSGQFILGPQVHTFEEEAARYLGAECAIGCNSGTDALIIALRALGISPGDDVLTTSFTFFATAEAISSVGARPVFVDIEPDSFNIDPSRLEAAITPRTKAIVPVHLFGHAAEMDAIRDIARRHELKIVEDAAQAFGATYRGQKVGTLGEVAAFSFFPSKNLGAFGDGGLIVTNDPRVAETARLLRTHGSQKKYQNEMLGYNSRLDEIQAAVLRVKLPHIGDWNAGRQQAARTYERLLADVAWIKTPTSADFAGHVFHQYTVRIVGRDRDEVRRRLEVRGIGSMVYYPVPVHRLPVYAAERWQLPVTEQAAREVLSLPIGWNLSEETISRVVDALVS